MILINKYFRYYLLYCVEFVPQLTIKPYMPMISDTSCNLDSLDVYVPSPENPWNVSKINHLYRRAGFGASKAEVLAALAQNDPSALVDSLIDQAIALNTTPPPIWSTWNRDQFEAAEDANPDNDLGFYRREGKNQMVNDLIQNRVRDRLTLFWSNHFVTEDDTYRSPAYQTQYYSLLQLHALGNFRDFVYDIGISNAMLVYLNGDENIRDRPNENYARELYELFSLGVDNGYDEDDIQETSKALTGYVDTNDIPWGDILFNPGQFSNDTKTIFGQTGNWGYDDVINILFQERASQVATFICSKLYAYFVSPTCSDAIVAQMAQTFIANNFEIAPVLRQLLKSQHFFNQEAIGAVIKSPCDLLICFYNELGFTLTNTDVNDYIRGTVRILGQDVLNPIDVEGWQGDEDWISPDLLIGRWESARFLVNRAWSENQQQFRDFVVGLPIGTAADGNLQTTLSGPEVDIVVRALVNYFFPRGMEDTVIFNEISGVFRDIDAFPPSYYEPDAVAPARWSLDRQEVAEQFYAFLNYIVDIPEFQLK
ncbi:DUF1800 domain-containing protein [Aquimarina sp. D1M17]|uniref:DUF1800 domain-containing protein n=1 Tax=Aquimarina acroporae TaxID=2937283 RepID=UPI0020BE2FC4|nr:DUF1800 domain-containing protein [Aquimarina acroporae]MCK8523766.1 DUF1800 domain-containing protein [Aquimarina acroporae]